MKTEHYLTLLSLLQSQQETIDDLTARVTTGESLSAQYAGYTNIINTWQLVNLSYQNIVRSPFPVTREQVYTAVQTPTLYQTAESLLASTNYTYPVYTYVWNVDLDQPAQSVVIIHPNPNFPYGATAQQTDANLGSALPTRTLALIAQKVKTRPISYQVFYLEYEWLGGKKYAFFMTYFPKPNQVYNNDSTSPDYNPCYIIGSGLLQ